VSYKIDRKYFLKERHKAYEAAETPECKHERCSACGVCDFDSMKNLLAEPASSAKPAFAASLLQGVASSTVRLRYAKRERVRFISHLDVLRELERSLRRADLPIVYSEGFSPRPKLSAGPPLALGWTSEAEWIDVELAGDWSEEDRLAGLVDLLNASSAPGITFQSAAVMPPSTGSLVAEIVESAYRASFPSPPFAYSAGELDQAVQRFLAAPEVVVQRTRKRRTQEVDIRPLVHDLWTTEDGCIGLRLATASSGSVKPTEVLQAALGLDQALVPLIRIHKFAATVLAGDPPDAHALAAVGVSSIEQGNIDYGLEPAGNASGHSGGPPIS
jgi:radical SAM-linked protein